MVKTLIERGHEEEVRVQANQGDWFCACGLAKELDSRGDRTAVLNVLTPYADTGWTKAAETVARFLSGWGRAAEAISLIRPLAESGDRLAINCLADLLARDGRIDDVIDLLGPRTSDWFHAGALVRLTEGLGRDDLILELLPSASPHDRRPSHHPVELRARVLERQGRADEAMLFLRTHIDAGLAVNVNHVEQLADLMIRHDRLGELRDLMAGRGGCHAAHRLASFLAGQGEVDLAVQELSPFIEEGSLNTAAIAAALLAEHGRADEAIEILRRAAAEHGNEDWVARMLSDLLVSQGRADEALAYAVELAAQPGWTPDEVLLLRAHVLATSGRRDQAISELRSHPDAGEWWVANVLAALLAEDGQLDEAIEVLRQPGCAAGGNDTDLAMLLVQTGRVKEAIEASHVRSARA